MRYSCVRYDDFFQLGIVLPKWSKELAERGFEGVSAVEFYDDIFYDDLGEERLPNDYKTGEYAGIAIEKVSRQDENGKEKPIGKRHIFHRGNVALYDLIDRSERFCITSPISYAGRTRGNKNARFMYALCIEIDGIKEKNGLAELLYSFEREFKPLPKPTYIVCSGSGLHLYYVFERPLPLWKNVFEQIGEAKKHLTRLLWSGYVTNLFTKIQFESINQPFRIVGTVTKDGSRAVAFKIGEKVTIEYMNSFLPAELHLTRIYKASCTLEEAKEKYPEWYKRRIIEKRERGTYQRHEPIYHNWIEKILSGAMVGHRYNCLENLCALAVQCGISPEQVEADCRRVAERFDLLTVSEDNHFTEYDILCAMRTYETASAQAYTRRIEFISKKTGIELKPNNRNGRPRAVHIKIMNAMREVLRPDGEWRNKDGRPTKKETVQAWRSAHPYGSKADCIRETGLTKPTVYKWWNAE